MEENIYGLLFIAESVWIENKNKTEIYKYEYNPLDKRKVWEGHLARIKKSIVKTNFSRWRILDIE